MDKPVDLNDLTPKPADPDQAEAALGWMRDQLNRYDYRPNWQLTIRAGDIPYGPAVLVARYRTYDSRERWFEGHRPIDPEMILCRDPNRFGRELQRILIDLETHESREWLRRDGQLFDDPHTDPTRWHCNHCGGVGPIRHEGNSYRCPGCQQVTTLPDATNPEQTGQGSEGPGAILGSPRARAGGQLTAGELARLWHDTALPLSSLYGGHIAAWDRSSQQFREWMIATAVQVLDAVRSAAAAPRAEPVDAGDVTVIGPECFASVDESVICWRGRNYVPQAEPVDAGPPAQGSYGNTNLGLLLAALDTAAKRTGSIDADQAREADEAYQSALEGLRAEMTYRSVMVYDDPLMQLITQYGDMRAQAVTEAEYGSNVESDLLEARAELIRDDIAATIRATHGQIRRITEANDQLLTQLEARPRRVWFAGDPEPDVDTRVLVAGRVWIRHPQLRWILWPGGNGCPGLEWAKLSDHADEFPLVEVLPHEQVERYGRLLREVEERGA